MKYRAIAAVTMIGLALGFSGCATNGYYRPTRPFNRGRGAYHQRPFYPHYSFGHGFGHGRATPGGYHGGHR